MLLRLCSTVLDGERVGKVGRGLIWGCVEVTEAMPLHFVAVLIYRGCCGNGNNVLSC